MCKIILLALAICVTTAEICEDVDTTACERVKLIRPGMCSEPYMSKQCKRHCGNCPLAKRNPGTASQESLTCYQCSRHLATQDLCTKTTQCQSGYVCAIKKTLSGGHIFWPLIEMGCILEQSCSKIGSGFGRRSASFFDLTPYCCKNNLCNDHQPLPPTTLMPTIPPNPYCPSGFQYVGGSCYLVNLTTMTWSKAQDFCRSHGAHLADFTTKNQMGHVLQKAVKPLSSYFELHDPHCWIDAVYSDSQHHWIWSHSSALIDYRSFTQLAHSSGKTSKCAFATYVAGITAFIFEVDVDCSLSYIPLCEVNPL
ncbi:uncharacterized protein LOC143056707 [Mytilus galloprovincialis]|uniref:uncharacterized protein LOC143056707 n=1 Tax=Mytilus galloprovincialis TaxID=29158 RepID=UPI003F7C2BF5